MKKDKLDLILKILTFMSCSDKYKKTDFIKIEDFYSECFENNEEEIKDALNSLYSTGVIQKFMDNENSISYRFSLALRLELVEKI